MPRRPRAAAAAAAAAAVLGAATAALAAAAAAAPPPPNILFLMADQMRYDALDDALTPNLAALARRGLRMANSYTATPSCTPARSALLTGLSPWWNGMLGYGDIAERYAFEMPREMAALGYDAVAIGKNHFYNGAAMPNNTSPPPSHGWSRQLLYDGLGSGVQDNNPGGEFDTYDAWFAATTGGEDPLATGKPLMDWCVTHNCRWPCAVPAAQSSPFPPYPLPHRNSWNAAPYVYDESLHPTAWVGAQARAYLANVSAQGPSAKPFFLKVSFHRPHSPYDPPARLLNATPASSLPPVRVGAPWDADFAGSDAPGAACGPGNADAWCGAMPEPNFTYSRRAYRASIKFVDEQVGLILAELDASGLAASTWIVFTSDHGDGQGDHNLWRKTFPWELSAHVPGFITWPSSVQAAVPRGTVTPLLGELRDVFPTVLDIAGRGDLTRSLNGSSWACLVLAGASGAACGPGSGGASGGGGGAGAPPWRETLDLEHSLIFGPRIHWNAILGGPTAGALASLKYIFFAQDATEQLFNLSSDPHEMRDLAPDAAFAAPLAALRGRLVAQFVREGRGASWVSANGTLLPRATGQVYSPHYPQPPSPPQPPIPSPPCAPPHWPAPWFCTPPGSYFKSCGGEAGNLAPLAQLTVQQAQAWCCANSSCAGFDFAPTSGNASVGNGFFKVRGARGPRLRADRPCATACACRARPRVRMLGLTRFCLLPSPCPGSPPQTNAMCGLATGTAYTGCWKPGQVPGH